MSRFDRLEDFLHAHTARALQQKQIAGPDEPADKFRRLARVFKKPRSLFRMPCFNGCSYQFRCIALNAEDPINLLELSGMPSALAMQFRRGRPQLQHLARSQ